MAFTPGENVFIRTLSYFYVGKLSSISESWIELDKASWVADTGRWHQALKEGTLSEVEPYVDPVLVNRSVIVDMTLWRHDLPTEQK